MVGRRPHPRHPLARAAQGVHVFVTGRRQVQLEARADELGDTVTGIRADIANLDDLDRVYAAIRERGEGLDIVVANAGGGAFATLAELKPDDFDQTFGTNVRGTVFTVQKALPLLNPDASVVITGSTSAARATAAFGVYSASKAAIRQFSRVWAIELAQRGVRVNAMTPGPTETPDWQPIRARHVHCWTTRPAESTRPTRATDRDRRRGTLPGLAPSEVHHRRRTVR